jgi:DNA-binding transcriptional MerR regulator
MKELVEATGVPKSTILHYLHQRLLPEPIKTSQNMAYYDPQCIHRIRYIRNLQRRHRLSLSEIRQMFEERGPDADFSIYLELQNIIFGQTTPGALLDEAGFCRATGLARNAARDLVKTRLLMPMTKGGFDPDDVSMGKLYARLLSSGLRIGDLVYYVELGEKIVDHEMKLRRRMTHHLPHDRDAALSLELVKDARMTRAYVIDRLFQLRVASMRDLKQSNSV